QRSDRRQHPQTPWLADRSRTPEDDHLESIHPHAYGYLVGHGLLHDRGVDDAWLGYVLLFIRHSLRDSAGPYCWGDAPSQHAVDGADRSQPDDGGVGDIAARSVS